MKKKIKGTSLEKRLERIEAAIISLAYAVEWKYRDNIQERIADILYDRTLPKGKK